MDLNQIMKKKLPLTNFTSNTKSDKGTVEPLIFHIKAERSLNLTEEVKAGLQVRDVTNGDLRLLYFKEATI